MTEHHDLESELQVSLHVNDQLRARIAALEEQVFSLEDMIEGVSNGVQQCRTDINMAAVWLPAIQRIREYLRAKDEAHEEARAAMEKK